MTCVGTRRESRASIVARFERVASSRVTSHLVSFTTTPMNIPWTGIDRNTTYKCADQVKKYSATKFGTCSPCKKRIFAQRLIFASGNPGTLGIKGV
jgi:hypothetical protein